MKQVLKYAGYLLIIALAGFLLWRFWYLIAWIFAAAAISFIGHPLVRTFDKVHIRKWKIPHTLSSLLALLVIVLMLLALLAIFVPMIVEQAATISRIDVNNLARNLQGPLQWFNTNLHLLGVIPDGQTLQEFVAIKVKTLVSLDNLSSMVGGFFSTAGNIFVGLFSIIFISFFFIKDQGLFEESLFLFIPEKHHHSTHKVINDSKNLLVRYFVGVVLEVLSVMSIIALFLWIFGVKNALLIGFFGGIMNIIPYLGPIIGSVIGTILGLTATLATGSYNDLLPALLKLVGVFAGANFIDNNFLVPMIYSSSVKAHPLEIFFIIIIGGSLAGILGMLLAVPVYTILRVIAREFFQQYRIVKKLTEKIE